MKQRSSRLSVADITMRATYAVAKISRGTKGDHGLRDRDPRETRPPSPHQPVPRERASERVKEGIKNDVKKEEEFGHICKRVGGRKSRRAKLEVTGSPGALRLFPFVFFPGWTAWFTRILRGDNARDPLRDELALDPPRSCTRLGCDSHNTTVRSGLRLESSTIGVLYKQHYTKKPLHSRRFLFSLFFLFFFFCSFFFSPSWMAGYCSLAW